jgi:hypothetical protein
MKLKSSNVLSISVKVFPNAPKNEVGEWENGRLKIKITVCPEKGKANEAVIALLAKHYGVPKRAVRIVRGLTSREKEIEIEGLKQQ